MQVSFKGRLGFVTNNKKSGKIFAISQDLN